MSGTEIGLTVAGVLGSLVLVGIVLVWFSGAAKRKEAEARLEFPDAARIDARALFFGQQSRGAAQMRGNGTLILTGAELLFKQWVVNREFRAALSAIVAIETPRSFLGKSQVVKLLCVRYQDNGEEDAMAWRVDDLDGWLAAIEQARGKP